MDVRRGAQVLLHQLEVVFQPLAGEVRGVGVPAHASIGVIGRLHLVGGFSSMFDFCQKKLGLSEATRPLGTFQLHVIPLARAEPLILERRKLLQIRIAFDVP